MAESDGLRLDYAKTGLFYRRILHRSMVKEPGFLV